MSNAPERITVARRIGSGLRDVMSGERAMSMGYVEATLYVRADLFDTLAADASRAADLAVVCDRMAQVLDAAISAGLPREIYRDASAALAAWRDCAAIGGAA